MDLVIATTNRHKVREIRPFLKAFGKFDIYTLLDFPNYLPPKESEDSFEKHAILKAVHAAKTLHMWAIADDSGLVVPSLNGEPGVFSARYAGEEASDKDNRKKLLKKMEGLEELARSAYFECCMVLASPEGLKKCVAGHCEGMIAFQERGGNGFGYDPIFIKHDYNQTFAELGETVKNQISHRAKALEKLLNTLDAVKEEKVISSSEHYNEKSH